MLLKCSGYIFRAEFSCSCFLHSVTAENANQIITAMEQQSEGIFCLKPEDNKDLSSAFSWHVYSSVSYYYALVCDFISFYLSLKKQLPYSVPLTETCIYKALSRHVPSHYLWPEENMLI